ncbi:MAG TPA: adenylate/guanylate cyclase domain-containing protein [Candidatus Bathyarchaeia archaeon]|nr:adenylate/guanylate cyclase domain-containing protein [Candidatus Bathyarchaeia archaeon]
MGKNIDDSSTKAYQFQTISNLYNSGIPNEIISLQLDITEEEVEKTIEKIKKEQESMTPKATASLDLFYLDAVVNVDMAIKQAQNSMWKALKSELTFDISMEETHEILEMYARSKVTLVILHIDLVDSTKLSMTLPIDRLTTIIQAFSREMSLMIEAYGGYILKYMGDAILAFFPVNIVNDPYLPCINAINCARSMIKVVQYGINPILEQYGYPEMGVRIGIDIGDQNAVLQYGWDIYRLNNGDNTQNRSIVKSPHYDIIGYTVNVAVKMTGLAKPNQIAIGQLVYEALDEKQRLAFEILNVSTDVWSYVSNRTGSIYSVYTNVSS